MKNRLRRPRSPILPRRELPRSADEIDLDRLVWDPEYRRAVRPLLEGEPESGPAGPRESAKKD